MRTVHYLTAIALAVPALLAAQNPLPQVLSDSAANCRWMARCSSPGLSYSLEEARREPHKGKSIVVYREVLLGFPGDKVFTMWRRVMGGCCLMQLGTDIVVDSTKILLSWVYTEEFLPGEPLNKALVSTDESLWAFAVAYPTPVRTSSGTCRLTLEQAGRNPDVVALIGEGFEPGEEVRWTGHSGKEILSGSLTVPADSSFIWLVYPGVKGKRGGTAQYIVEGIRCRLDLSQPWGDKLKPR